MKIPSEKDSASPIPYMNRRNFMQSTAAAGLAAFPAGVWAEEPAKPSTSANDKLRILCVGTANRAARDIDAIKEQNIVALCDVDKNFLEKAAAQFPAAKTYADYRQMIDREAATADAIMVATTDHHHASASLRGIQAGLHCYCEKPLTHTIEEARVLANAAKAKGVATQMGTQIHAGSNYRRVVELIQAGTIGDVTDVHVWVGKGWGGGERPKTGQTPPAHLNWDLWLGPAPQRPYSPDRYHPGQWRRWWDFGQGTLGDMGCHYMDLPFWALGLRHPIHCEAEGPPVHPETCPTGLIVRYRFPARDNRPAVNLTWYDGDRVPKMITGEAIKGSGVMFVGSAGKLFANYTEHRLYPSDKFADFEPPAPSIPDSIGHHAEWVQACKQGTPTTCNFDYSGSLTETVLLGNVAYRVGKAIDWDAASLTAKNCPEASAWIKKQYRAGWEVA